MNAIDIYFWVGIFLLLIVLLEYSAELLLRDWSPFYSIRDTSCSVTNGE